MPRSQSITFGIAAVEDVLGGEQELVDRRAHSALQEGGLARVAHGLQELVVLHVAGADLEHVGILGDHRHMLRGHHLGDDRQAGLAPRGGEHLEARFLVSLEAVGAGAGLERPAPKPGRSSALSLLRQGDDLLFALDRTRAGDDGDPACRRPPGSRAFTTVRSRLQLRRGPLVGGHDRQDLLDPLARLEHLGQPRTLLADARR